MQSEQTQSETLFLRYCDLRGYIAKRIPTPADRDQFPDYEVRIAQTRLIVEVKELRANPSDENVARIIQEGRVEVFGDEPGRRIRSHIEKAEKQLRRYEAEQVPCLVVLYDNIVVNGFRPYPPGGFLADSSNPLNPYQVDVGMYGLEAVRLRLQRDGPPECIAHARGRERTLRAGHQDNISAVASLHDYDQNYGLFLLVYHNFFAKNPLPKALFSHAKDKQLEKPGHPETCPGPWQRVQAVEGENK